jgi:hypothetical protein
MSIYTPIDKTSEARRNWLVELSNKPLAFGNYP